MRRLLCASTPGRAFEFDWPSTEVPRLGDSVVVDLDGQRCAVVIDAVEWHVFGEDPYVWFAGEARPEDTGE